MRFARSDPKGWPNGLHAIFGVRPDGISELQSVRADAGVWSEDAFRRWLEDHGLKAVVEEASSKAADSEPLPDYMLRALRRGIGAHEAGRTGDGLRPRTIAEAREGIESGRWPHDKWVRARAWFARHEGDWDNGTDDRPGEETPGFAAWLLWGDEDGRGRRKVEKIAESVQAQKQAPLLLPPPVPNREPFPYSGVIDLPGGFRALVETAMGETRSGTDPDGNRWSIEMPAHYCEIEGTEGADGEPLDAFIGQNLTSPLVFCMAIKTPGSDRFDEDKLFIGFETREEAEACFEAAYDRDDLRMELRELKYEELEAWILDRKNEGKKIRAGRLLERFKAMAGALLGERGAALAIDLLKGEEVSRVSISGEGEAPALGDLSIGSTARIVFPVVKGADGVQNPDSPMQSLAAIEVDVAVSAGLLSKLEGPRVARKATGGSEVGEKNRLSDIRVKEVSIVDSAANNRVFAIVKAANPKGSEEMPKPGTKPEDEKKAAPAEEEKAVDTAEKVAEPEAKAAEPAEKAESLHDTLLAEKFDALRMGAEKLLSGYRSMTPDDAQELLSAMRETLWSIGETTSIAILSKGGDGAAPANPMADIVGKLDAALADVPKAGDAAEGTPPAEPEVKASMSEEEARKKAAAHLVHVFGGDRLKAVAAVTAAGEEAVKAAAAEAEAEKADPMATIGAGIAAIVHELRGIRASIAAGGAPTMAAEPAAAEAPEVEKDTLVSTIEGLQGSVAGLVSRVAKMEKRPDRPVSAEPSGQRVEKKKNEDSWPIDMAADSSK